MSKAYRIIVDGGEGSPAWTFETDSYEMARDEINYGKEVNDAILHGGFAVQIREADGFICQDTRHHEILQAYENLSAEEYASGIRPIGQAAETAAYSSVYIDIDGTAAYWYKDGRGFSYPEEILDPNNHYYRDLEPHHFIVDLAHRLMDEGFDVCVLSATDRCCMADRWAWIEENMPFIPKENIFMCPIGADKQEFCKGNASNSVLIDDYEKNLDRWSGVGIKSINSVNSHSDKYMNIYTHLFESTDKASYEFNLDETVRKIYSALHELKLEKVDVAVSGYNYVTAPAVKSPYVDFHLNLNKYYFDKVKEIFPEKFEKPTDIDVVARVDENVHVSLIGCTNSCADVDISDVLDKEFLDAINLAVSNDTEIICEDHIQALSFLHKLKQNKPDKDKPKFDIER